MPYINVKRSDHRTPLASLERSYRRKVKDMGEKVKYSEHLEEELQKMWYLEGEVEHLKAVVMCLN
jgi:hypothetical protein